MFVSLLQLMGFSSAKPVHSRAEESTLSKVAKPADSTVRALPVVTPVPEVQVNPARRSTVKAQAVKHEVAVKKTAAPGKPVKAQVPAAPVAPKSKAPKPVAKPAPDAKPATNKAAPTPAKPGTSGDAFKPAKVPEPSVAAKPVVSSSKKKSDEVSTKIKAEVIAKPAESESKSVTAAPPMTALGIPVRSGRPSSRLAQLTVPSMAQSVASTAAKASFTQMTPVQPIVPPLASSVKKDPALADNWRTKPVTELTDAEVIAMSDDDYMNDTQMAFFRIKLVTLKNDILSNAGETTEHLREDTVVVPDPADRATIEEEHALELRTRDRERKLLKKIEQSISRIDAGDYGYCDETGEPIGVGRLLARPTATLSLEAQQRRELKQKMFGD